MTEMIRIEGMDQVKAALAALDAKVQGRAMRGALSDAGSVVQAAVEEAAPVRVMVGGTSLPIGALKSDITKRVTRSGGVLMAIIQPGDLTYHVARWVEYGHRLVRGGYSSMKRGRMRGRGRQVGEVPAYPFIRPAFEASVSPCVQAFIERLKNELRKRS